MDSNDSKAMAKSRKRPPSRASTASIHSVTTQPNVEQSFTNNPNVFATQWMAHNHNQGHSRENAAPAHDMSAEALMLHAAAHLQDGGGRDFSMEVPVSVNTSIQSAPFNPNNRSLSRHSMSAESFGGNGSFAEDSQILDRDGNEEAESFASMPGNAKPGSRSSANNELEMRQLFVSNQSRTLQDVAEELHGNERGPNSERTRQVFAMLWINQVCSRGKGSVPRGRVYANYASRCATERITVLNPASFGKLVRVLFPGLKTRRLGVRGESKYHYVNFTLKDDQPDAREPEIAPQMPLIENTSFSQDFNDMPYQPAPPVRADRAIFPAPDLIRRAEKRAVRARASAYSLYNQPIVSSLEQLQSFTAKTERVLSLAPDPAEGVQSADPLVLPKIEPFLPEGTDPDAAKSLAALYRSHCTSLVECIRYCKEKTFFHLFTSFQGTLTMPVQKLFGHPAIAPWIEECDMVLYQRMVRIISILALQVVPRQVLDTLRAISNRLVAHIQESFQGQPAHVIRAKEAPATIFAALIDRILRVNLTAHAAANMLSNAGNRDVMYLEWITMIHPRKIAECVPLRGMDDVANVLITEIRDLLGPVTIAWEVEAKTLHGDVALKTGRQPREEHQGEMGVATVLDRWVSFLQSLPARFPYAAHSDIVWCVQRVGTAVLRDLTISQGKSFGSWWVTKCWIDEMILFLAEQGGFLSQTTAQTYAPEPKQQAAATAASRQGPRYSSGSDDLNMPNMPRSQPGASRFFQSAPMTNNHDTLGNGQSSHDDSGIGIRTPDEDPPALPAKKFSFATSHSQDLFVEDDLQPNVAEI